MRRYLFIFAILIVSRSLLAGPPADFSVDPVNPPFRLADAKGKFVALHFLLKTECPLCLKHTHDYANRAAEVPGVEHIFLKPDEPAETRKWLAKVKPSDGPRPAIYHDPDATLAKQFNIPDGYKFHGQTVHYPALVLLDPQGKEVFRYVGKSNADRFSFDKFAAKIGELSESDANKSNLAPGDVAIKGHDPTAYFLVGQGIKGRDDITARYRGATYRFASKETRQRFAEDPDHYVPSFGGWSAALVALGEVADVDPACFKIQDDRLLLFNGAEAKASWEKDEATAMKNADASWPKVASKMSSKSAANR